MFAQITRTRGRIAAACLTLIAFAWLLALVSVNVQETQENEHVGADLRRTARLLEETTRRTLQLVDLTLLDVKREFERNPWGPEFAGVIAQNSFAQTVAVQISITDARGIVRYSSLGPVAGEVYVGDRDHIRVHERSASVGLHVGQTVVGRVSGRPSLQLTRRLDNPDGSLAGVVLFALDPGILIESYAASGLGDAGVVAVFGHDERERVQWAAGQGLSADPAMTRIIELGRRGETLVTKEDSRLGDRRTLALQPVQGLELLLVVGADSDEMRGGMILEGLAVLMASALMTLLLTGLWFALDRDLRGRRVSDHALAESNALLEQRVVERTESLAASHRALQQSDSQLRLITDHAPVLIAYVDQTRRFRFVNRLAEQWYGRSASEIVGRRLDQVLLPAHVAAMEDVVTDVLAGQRRQFEREVIYPDGAKRWVLMDFVPDVRGSEVAGYVVLIVDLSEHKRVERQLQQAMRMDAIGQLTGGVAHDFNNLLSIVLGNLDLLRLDGKLGAPSIERIDRAARAVERGAELTQRLLAFSRRQVLKPELVEVANFLSDLQRFLGRTLGEQVRIEVGVAEDLWPITIDLGQLENALVNLALNARDAMPSGGSLRFAAENLHLDGRSPAEALRDVRGDFVCLSVQDTGIGIAPDVVDRIFEPFFTTKGVGKGTGLGLSMVYGFVKQSGGYITVESRVGQGTQLSLYLPRAVDAVTSRVKEVSAPAPEASSGARVLVVEDNPDVREYSVQALQALGYSTSWAGNAVEAEAVMARGERIDILFTDVVLPGGMDGIEFAKIAAARNPRLKVLLTSGYVEGLRSRRTDLGSVALLRKPFRVSDLSAHLADLEEGGGFAPASGSAMPSDVAGLHRADEGRPVGANRLARDELRGR